MVQLQIKIQYQVLPNQLSLNPLTGCAEAAIEIVYLLHLVMSSSRQQETQNHLIVEWSPSVKCTNIGNVFYCYDSINCSLLQYEENKFHFPLSN